MATINAVGTSLSSQTGTGTFVGSTSPTLTTPSIIGLTSGSNPAAGMVGEVISSTILGASSISLLTGAAKNLTSISLTAGNWYVCGSLNFFSSTGTMNSYVGWINTVSVTQPDAAFCSSFSQTPADISGLGIPLVDRIYNFTTTTTVYASGYMNFVTGTGSFCGTISAIRIS